MSKTAANPFTHLLAGRLLPLALLLNLYCIRALTPIIAYTIAQKNGSNVQHSNPEDVNKDGIRFIAHNRAR